MSTRTFSLGAGEQDVLAHAKASPEIALAEIIWNSLDADATVVNVELRRAVPLGPVTAVIATDDGHGIGPQDIDAAFAKHRSSPKTAKRTSPGGRPMHGRNGRGRFRSFAIASDVRWRTWGEDLLGNVVGTEVRLSTSPVTGGEIRDLEGSDSDLSTRTGTRVVMTLADNQKAGRIGDDFFRSNLEAVMASTLLSLAGATVTFDGELLDPDSQIEHKAQPELVVDLTEFAQLDGTPAGQPVLEVIEWTTSAVPPCLYLCDEDGVALVEHSGKPPKHPGIDWTAYLRWEGFARDTVNEGDLQNARATFGPIIEAATASLARAHRSSPGLLGGVPHPVRV